MDNKEAIIQATIKLIEEKGEHLEEVTVREICKRAGVGLGLVNYHFGNKDKLIEQCIERMINGTVEHFQNIREKTDGFTPFEKLEYLGNMTLDFLFEHYAVSKISILTDMQSPKEGDNMKSLSHVVRFVFDLSKYFIIPLLVAIIISVMLYFLGMNKLIFWTLNGGILLTLLGGVLYIVRWLFKH